MEQPDMNKRTCTMPECDKPHRARGLCGTHYNQQNPNKYRTVTIQCAYCGTDCEKEAGRANKYANLYCSTQCRDWERYGTSRLPADHWARWYGRTCKLPTPKREPEAKPCNWCGDQYQSTKVTDRYCSRPCNRRAGKARRRAREAEAPGEYSWGEVMRIHMAGNRQCSYCDVVTGAQPDPDHVVPLSRGGRNDIGNILPCCQQCNGDKGDMTLAEWAEYRERRGKPAVRIQFDRAEPRFRHLIDGIASGQSHRLVEEAERMDLAA